MGIGHQWSEAELVKARELHNSGKTWEEVGFQFGVSGDAAKRRVHMRLPEEHPKLLAKHSESPYPKYDSPLVMEGNALVIADTEFPFHNAEFLNHCYELTQAWGVKQAIIAGDALHFDSLSQWAADFKEPKGGLDEDQEAMLMDYIKSLPEGKQAEGLEILVKIGGCVDDSVSTELAYARKEMKVLSQNFDRIDFVVGNHDFRLLAALKSDMFPQELLRLLEAETPKWRIAPYFYSVLNSGNRKFQIEHPKMASENGAIRLADVNDCSIIMGHSHAWSVQYNSSGKHWAIQTGCCCDEMRMPYASQRHNSRKKHKMGATIIMDGYPFVLSEDSPWEMLLNLHQG